MGHLGPPVSGSIGPVLSVVSLLYWIEGIEVSCCSWGAGGGVASGSRPSIIYRQNKKTREANSRIATSSTERFKVSSWWICGISRQCGERYVLLVSLRNPDCTELRRRAHAVPTCLSAPTMASGR
jgi:hypothetical protein